MKPAIKINTKVWARREGNEYARGKVLKVMWRWGRKYEIEHSLDFFQERDAFDVSVLYKANDVFLELPSGGEEVGLYSTDLKLAARLVARPTGLFGRNS